MTLSSHSPLRILLINPPFHRKDGGTLVPPIALGYLSAIARQQGAQVTYYDGALRCNNLGVKSLRRYESVLRTFLSNSPHPTLIGIGPCTFPALRGLVSTVNVVKELLPEVPLILGGPMPSVAVARPTLFEHLAPTGIVVGEGEITWAELIEKFISCGELPQVAGIDTGSESFTPRTALATLDKLPFPDRQRFQGNGYHLSDRRCIDTAPFVIIQATRGCPYSCGFCAAHHVFGHTYRQRSLSSLLVEIEECIRKLHIRHVVFYDDNIAPTLKSTYEYLLPFAQELINHHFGITWQMEMRPEVAFQLSDDELNLLWNSGCQQMNLGLEKGYDKGIKSIGKIHTSQQAIEGVIKIRRIVPKLRIAGTFIIGGPGETPAEARQTIQHATDLKLDWAIFNPWQVYPGTPIYEQAVADDAAPRSWWDAITLPKGWPMGEMVYTSPMFPADEVMRLVAIANRQFYVRPSWAARRALVQKKLPFRQLLWNITRFPRAR